MRLRALCLAALLAASPALAQAQTRSRASAGPETRYFTAIEGLMGDADVILKETRQGGSVTAATLDVCYDVDKTSDRKDRFVATLAVQGTTLSGTTESVGEKRPVSIRLTQKPGADGVDFQGEIAVGGTKNAISSSGNSDLSETEYEEIRGAGEAVVSAPPDFTEVSPESVAVKVRLDAAGEFLKSLRGQPLEIASSSLVISCAALRAGTTTLNFTIDPSRAPAFLASARSFPGVVAAGWSSGTLDLSRAVRIPGGPWRDGDRVSRDKIVAALSGLLQSTYRAKLQSSRWNDLTGKLTLLLKRPAEALPGLGLSETLEVTAFVAPDRPEAGDRLILWLGLPVWTTHDEAAEGKLNFADPVASDDADFKGMPELVSRLAATFGGQRWDYDTSSWK